MTDMKRWIKCRLIKSHLKDGGSLIVDEGIGLLEPANDFEVRELVRTKNVVLVAKERVKRETELKDWLYHRPELDGWTGKECLSFAKAILSIGKLETDASP